MQSTLSIACSTPAPAHVAVIMDGNGRWATRRGRPRTAGHLAGARATRQVVAAAARAGVRELTLYAFSADNWARPAAEVRALMRLFARYLAAEAARCAADGVRLRVIGRRDRLDPSLLAAVEHAERTTGAGRGLRVRLAIDYSARDAIVAASAREAAPDRDGAAPRGGAGAPNDSAAPDRRAGPDDPAGPHGPAARARFARAVARAVHDPDPPADVDLLVRTGGELRLSDFLLWECAYAELWFTDVLWPDFTPRHLGEAFAAYARRQRRFGALPPADAPDAAAARRRSCA
jgi:undecaprenyl diphosphate synthase